MAKAKTSYICSACGAGANSWSGKCFDCQEWCTLEAMSSPSVVVGGKAQSSGTPIKGSLLKEAKTGYQDTRIKTGMDDIDQVLGGGIVAGSVILLAGQPGAGKSTLLLQLAALVGSKTDVLYASGEESEAQVAARANRLGLASSNLKLASNNSADDIAATIAGGQFDLVVVDSIQTIATSAATGAQGGISQIVNSSHLLINAAKQSGTALILVGHVTKEGNIAGPKLLEHLVDAVLQLEGDKFVGFKLLRGRKNRYGSVDEVAVLEMTGEGMRSVANPSATLLEERQVTDGSVVFAAMEGTQPLLVEIQALTNKTSYGYAKRTAVGFNQNRLNLLIAVLEKRTTLKLSETDIYISVSSGMTVTEPAADLAVCMAIASSARGMALSKDAVVYGEVGLGGELRHVTFAGNRAKESKRVGFKTIIAPPERGSSARKTDVRDLRTALNTYLKPE